jgi:hypothetical protein
MPRHACPTASPDGTPRMSRHIAHATSRTPRTSCTPRHAHCVTSCMPHRAHHARHARHVMHATSCALRHIAHVASHRARRVTSCTSHHIAHAMSCTSHCTMQITSCIWRHAVYVAPRVPSTAHQSRRSHHLWPDSRCTRVKGCIRNGCSAGGFRSSPWPRPRGDDGMGGEPGKSTGQILSSCQTICL